MKENENLKNDIWGLLIWILPAVALPQFAGEVGGETPEIAMSMILGALGGAIGFPLYWIAKDKSKVMKIGISAVLILGFIGVAIFLSNRTESEKRSLITCEICGYKALEKKGGMCEICLVEIGKDYEMELAMEDEEITLEELIKEDQVLFFATEEGVTFLQPKIYDDDGYQYLKDENWKPMATQAEVDQEKKY